MILYLNMYTHKFKVLANIVCSVQIITSEVTFRWFWQKKRKKKKRNAKIKPLTVQRLLFSLIILVTFHTVFASFYFALFQYLHDIWLKYTKFRNGALLMTIFISRHKLVSLYFHFQMMTSVNVSGFSPNLVYALILWRSGLRLLMGKFHLFLTNFIFFWQSYLPATPLDFHLDDN